MSIRSMPATLPILHSLRALAAAIAFGWAVSAATATTAAADSPGGKVTPNLEQAIPNIPGKSLIAVEVDYPPGGASVPHVHAKSAVIYAYVVSGAIESQVNDGAKRVYRAGESWFEPPGSSHPVSRNASQTEPAKLLAVFVADTEEKALTIPARSITTTGWDLIE